MAAPLVVNVLELLRRPGSTKDLAATLDAAAFDFGDERVLERPIEVNAHLESMSDGITVSGTATMWIHGECRRCLRPLEESVAVRFDELYQATVQDPDAHPIDQDQAALLPMVRENLLLAMPMAPLCRPDCAGLCPTCGADLNQGPCACPPPAADDRWSALDELKQRLADGDETGR